MRYIIVLVLVMIAGSVLYIAQTSATGTRKEQGKSNAQVQSQQSLQKSIEMIFLKYPEGFEEDNKKERIDQLGTREEVTSILRQMLVQYQHAQEESIELSLIYGATSMLGEMADKQSQDRLAQMAFDPLTHEDIRAVAVRSLGNIDALSNKELLLKALSPDRHEFMMVRVYAAEGLGRIKAPDVLAALEQAAQQESDSFVREKFQAAAQEIRSKQ
jgi:HEAT repeat protein